jgi:hypothetical protein
MLVEAAIQDHDQPSDHRSASEPGHADMVTIVVDDRPSDVQPVLTLPREMEMLGAPRDFSSDDNAGQPASPGPVPPPLHETPEVKLCLSLQTPLIRGPRRLRRPRTPVSVLSPWRNDRLAKKAHEADSTKQAQCVLMQKLGVVASSPNVDSEMVPKYKSTFQAPLSASKQEVLQLLFGEEFDSVAMNLDMVGMDEV